MKGKGKIGAFYRVLLMTALLGLVVMTYSVTCMADDQEQPSSVNNRLYLHYKDDNMFINAKEDVGGTSYRSVRNYVGFCRWTFNMEPQLTCNLTMDQTQAIEVRIHIDVSGGIDRTPLIRVTIGSGDVTIGTAEKTASDGDQTLTFSFMPNTADIGCDRTFWFEFYEDTDASTDFDLYTDGTSYFTLPILQDNDKDGIADINDDDDDNDGFTDVREQEAGTDPLDPESRPIGDHEYDNGDSEGGFPFVLLILIVIIIIVLMIIMIMFKAKREE